MPDTNQATRLEIETTAMLLLTGGTHGFVTEDDRVVVHYRARGFEVATLSDGYYLVVTEY
jgi:hypothetical protein